jgi:pantoate--beta-alanine ligase
MTRDHLNFAKKLYFGGFLAKYFFMILFKKTADLTHWLKRQQAAGLSIGFVPTLGALHQGHISLIDISRSKTALTVCSIFVNPTQFNDPADFKKYPVTLEKDIALLEKAGTDALFLPDVNSIYPDGTSHLEHYDLGSLESVLEGKYRPGHFQGVCQVMYRLLDIVRPDHLFMGSKDYQQCMVVQRLLAIMGLPATLHRCPIVREPDGLAMSSRNTRLDPAQRLNAPAIYRALQIIRKSWRAAISVGLGAPIGPLVASATDILEKAGFRIDYISIADRDTLQPAPEGSKNAIALIAAFQGEVRLIDNLSLQD